MKKLFISCPMRGRTDENIKKSMEKMHKIAEIVFDEELEVIDSFIEGNQQQDENAAIWHLGESIKKMRLADYYIGINDAYCDWRGCAIENSVARDYGLRAIFVNTYDLMPDAVEVARKREDERMGKCCL